MDEKIGRAVALLGTLSSKEVLVAEGIYLGKTYKEIAEYYNIAPGTVKNMVASVYEKLGIQGKCANAKLAAAIAYAKKDGLYGF